MSAPGEAHRTKATRVVGITAWTSNAAEAHPATAKIPSLWARFTHEDWFVRLERVGAVGPTIAVYSDYETAVAGDYRILLGREVDGQGGAVANLESVQIPTGRYAVFRFEGAVPQAVIHGWQEIWAFFAQPGPLQRAYTADLEVYHADGTGVAIWIAVR